MRIRRKPWARPELEASSFYVENSEEQRGQWREQFSNPSAPLHIELGCGKGGFMAQKSLKNLDTNFMAFDIKSDMLGVARRKIDAAYGEAGKTPDNVRLSVCNIEQIAKVVSPEDEVSRIYINFCNPWPRKKHKKKRLTHPRQLVQYKEFLQEGGEIWFKTDDDELFEESLLYFEMCGFTQEYLTRDLAASDFKENIITEHEQMFMDERIKIKFLIAKNHRGAKCEVNTWEEAIKVKEIE